MKSFGFGKHALIGGVAVALLAGCSGSQPPIGATGAMPQTSNLHGVLPFSRFLTSSGGNEVQFVTEDRPPGIAEFDYSKGDAPIRHWGLKHGTGPTAACTAGSQTFWIVLSKANEIVEYAVGRERPIKTLTVTGGEPSDCTVDPTTSDLAVTLGGTSSVIIFAKGSGSGKVITDKLDDTLSSTYDATGNLFVNGYADSEPALAELPKKRVQFKLLSFSNKLANAGLGALRWDGTYLAMHETGYVNAIYRYRASGTTAKLEGMVNGIATDCGRFWFWTQAGLLFCPVWTDGGYALVYDYPAGGDPIAQLGPIRDYMSGIVSLTR